MKLDLAFAALGILIGASVMGFSTLSAQDQPKKLLNKQTYRFEIPDCGTDMECEWKYGSPDEVIFYPGE